MDDFLERKPALSFPRLFRSEGSLAGDLVPVLKPSSKRVDCSISLPRPNHPGFSAFVECLSKACEERNLSFQVIHDGTVMESLRALRSGELTIGFHLDFFSLWHIASDPYAELAQTIQDNWGVPVNPPARARALTDKINAHGELCRKGLSVPESLVLRSHVPLELSAISLNRFLENNQSPTVPGFFLKKANGFGGKGVTYFKNGQKEKLATELLATFQQEQDDSYILQAEMAYPFLELESGLSRPAYWRILYCLGETYPFWWKPAEFCHPGEMSYISLKDEEIRRHRLFPLLDCMEELIAISGLDWFSSELCLSTNHGKAPQGGESRAVVAIDYFNDQCHVDVQSRWHGAPPDATVEALARRFAARALGFSRLAIANHAA